MVLCTSAAVLFEFLNLKRDVCIFGLAPAPAWSILQAVSPISKYVFLLRQQAIFSDSLQHQPEMRRYLLMPMWFVFRKENSSQREGKNNLCTSSQFTAPATPAGARDGGRYVLQLGRTFYRNKYPRLSRYIPWQQVATAEPVPAVDPTDPTIEQQSLWRDRKSVV